MLRLLNIMLVFGVLLSGFGLYKLEHKTRTIERQIAKTDKQIESEYEFIGLLHAEWSLLTRPQRLEVLARDHLDMGPVFPDQIVTIDGVAAILPPAPSVTPDATPQGDDPLAELLRNVQ